MGDLNGFIGYLKERGETLRTIERDLCALQQKYETYFAEVARVRESELQQLTQHILADRSKLPDWFNQALDKAEAAVEQELEDKLAKLKQSQRELAQRAEKTRQKSLHLEQKLRKSNVELDSSEEALKARSAKLLGRIEEYNGRIRQLSRGFGFFANFFKMRRLAAERRELDQEQADLAARIDALRQRWSKSETTYGEKEQGLRETWTKQQTEAAALQTKVEYLQTAWPRLVQRSTVERVLFELEQQLPEPAKGDPPCPRCKSPNPRESHFCHLCARRLTDDRPDVEGSLKEIAEINLHHQRFSEGMQAGQEIIGLVRGLNSGIEAFLKSVRDVKASQDRYASLKTLRIDVPKGSVEYGKAFDALTKLLSHDLSVRPQLFAVEVRKLSDNTFTETQIKAYFERMGEELSKQAHAQWD